MPPPGARTRRLRAAGCGRRQRPRQLHLGAAPAAPEWLLPLDKQAPLVVQAAGAAGNLPVPASASGCLRCNSQQLQEHCCLAAARCQAKGHVIHSGGIQVCRRIAPSSGQQLLRHTCVAPNGSCLHEPAGHQPCPASSLRSVRWPGLSCSCGRCEAISARGSADKALTEDSAAVHAGLRCSLHQLLEVARGGGGAAVAARKGQALLSATKRCRQACASSSAACLAVLAGLDEAQAGGMDEAGAHERRLRGGAGSAQQCRAHL